MGTFQVLYRGKIWYAYDTVEGYKFTRDGRAEIMSDDEFTYALKSGDVKMLEKKDKKMKENKVIEIKEEVTIGKVILEKGDKIEVLKESLADDVQSIQGNLTRSMAMIEKIIDNNFMLFEIIDELFDDYPDHTVWERNGRAIVNKAEELNQMFYDTYVK